MSVSSTTALAAERLVVYRGATAVLQDLDLTVGVGEVVAIRGLSGSGKSTLLAAISGLLPVHAGTISVAGTRVDHGSDRRKSRVRRTELGLVFQADEFIPELTVGENIMLPVALSRRSEHRRGSADGPLRLRELTEQLGIGELGNRKPSEISGGQLQRAAVARAVVHEPTVVLADEPTASLDADASRAAMDLLIQLARQRGAAVIVVTHDDRTIRLCDRSLPLADGRLRDANAPVASG